MVYIFFTLIVLEIFAIIVLSFLLFRLWRERRALAYECEALRIILEGTIEHGATDMPGEHT